MRTMECGQGHRYGLRDTAGREYKLLVRSSSKQNCVQGKLSLSLRGWAPGGPGSWGISQDQERWEMVANIRENVEKAMEM